jgi:hypothetical protein
MKSTNKRPIKVGPMTTLAVILNILTGILFLPGDLTLTTLGQTPKVPFVSSTHSVTAVSRTVFDLHIPFTLSWICIGKYICHLSIRQYDGSIIDCT